MILVAIGAVTTAILAGVPVLVMWIVGRFVKRWAAMAVGVLAMAAIIFLVVDSYLICGARPIIGPQSEGVPHIECDGPGGAISYLLIWIIGPVSGALVLAATLFQYRQLLRYR